jgi:hypothetical protein
MKKHLILWICLLSWQMPLLAQKAGKLHGFGIDVVKNLPFWLLPQPYETLSGSSSGLIIEPMFQFTTPKPNRYLNLTLGFARTTVQADNGRVVRNVTNVYAQAMRERQNEIQNAFWSYGGFLAVGGGDGYINIKGNYFDDYRAPVPRFSGMSLAVKTQAGFITKIAERWQLRSSVSGSLGFVSMGQPNLKYLPGVGLAPLLIEKFGFIAGLNVQLFYLPKRKEPIRSIEGTL